ncbi:hypothetical protein ACF0H5_024300 [Mactra antiquata]
MDVLHYLLSRETASSLPCAWTEEDADDLMEMLKSPAPASNDEFEPWFPGFEKAVLALGTDFMSPRIQAEDLEDYEFESWSPAFEKAVFALETNSRLPKS